MKEISPDLKKEVNKFVDLLGEHSSTSNEFIRLADRLITMVEERDKEIQDLRETVEDLSVKLEKIGEVTELNINDYE